MCACTGTADGLLYAPTSIAAVASLPARAGGTISFAEGHAPSRLTLPRPQATSSVKGQPPPMMTATSTPAANPSDSVVAVTHDLTTGAKAGIGVGAAALGLAALGLVLWLSTWYRRARSRWSEAKASLGHATASGENGVSISPPLQWPSPGYHHPGDARSMAGSVPPSYNSPAWPGYSGFKSELPADSERGFRSELPAGDPVTESTIDMREASGTPQPPSASGSPAPCSARGTLVSDIETSSVVSGSLRIGSGLWYVSLASPRESVGVDGAQVAPLSELHS